MTNIIDCYTQIMCYKKNATKSRKPEQEGDLSKHPFNKVGKFIYNTCLKYPRK